MTKKLKDKSKRWYRIKCKDLYRAVRIADFIRRTGKSVDIAISSRRHIFLDSDGKDRDILMKFLAICKAICKLLKIRGRVFETPRGYHFYSLDPVRKDTWRQIYKFLLVWANENGVLDKTYLAFVIERDYATLRLNQEKCIASIDRLGRLQKCPEIEYPKWVKEFLTESEYK